MNYFARISSKASPSNQLQKHLLSQLEKFDNILTDDPQALFKQIEALADQAAYTYRRCTRMPARVYQDYKTKEINAIGASGLFTLAIHKVAGHFPALTPAEALPVAEQLTPELAHELNPAPAEPPVLDNRPRYEVWENRENQRVLRMEELGKFSADVQALLLAGKIWGIYENIVGQLIAEEFGGKTHPLTTD